MEHIVVVQNLHTDLTNSLFVFFFPDVKGSTLAVGKKQTNKQTNQTKRESAKLKLAKKYKTVLTLC